VSFKSQCYGIRFRLLASIDRNVATASFQNKLLSENAELRSQLSAAVADVVERYSGIVKLAAIVAKTTGQA
jgi:hypothetical protein